MHRRSLVRILGWMVPAMFLVAACTPTTSLAPTADAGPDRTVAVGAVVTLDAGESSDPLGRSLAFSWSFQTTPEGSTATIESDDQVVASFLADLPGVYVIDLVVSNGETSDGDSLVITASAGSTLAPGESVFHEDGAVVVAQAESMVDAFELLIETVEDPSTEVPLPDGVRPVGQAFAFSSHFTVPSDPDFPFVIGFVVPDGESPDHLAIAVLESDVQYAPPFEDGADLLGATWVVLDATFHPESGLLFAPVYQFVPDGWTAMIVHSEEFDTQTTVDIAAPAQATTPTFQGFCGPGFDSAVENCTVTSTTLAADMLEDAYFDLTGLGFTTKPRLERGASTVVISYSPPFNLSVRVVLGPYRIQLRPDSTSDAGGMYSSSTGRVWIAIGTGGMTEGQRSVVRHEYVHATQYGYDPSFTNDADWLRARWSIEGHAVLLQNGYQVVGRDTSYEVRDLSHPLSRSRWDGNAWGALPNSEYHAQDFWAYLANRFGHTSAQFLRPFMEEGMRAAEVDLVLRAQYAGAFGQGGLQGGLARAYWEWAKNHVFEKQVAMGAGFGNTCTFTAGSAAAVNVNYSLTSETAPRNGSLEPLSTAVYRVNLPAPAGNAYNAAMLVDLGASHLRSAIYRDQPGSTACHGQADTVSRVATVDAASTYYVVVSNVSSTSDGTFSLSFPGLTITHPAPGASLSEGAIGFRAVTPGHPGTVITWTRVRPDVAPTVFNMGTSTSGSTLSHTLCDGLHHVTASATIGGQTVSRSIAIDVADLGATNPPPACAPSIDIVEPIAGNAYPQGQPVTLRATTSVAGGGTTAYPVQWRLGSPSGSIIATGAETTATFGSAGTVLLFATYGVASDSVSFTVAAGDPPSASILSPADGTTYAWFDYVEDFTGITVPFIGLGISDGSPLPQDAHSWQYRRLGTATWTGGFSGTTPSIFFGYSGANVFQWYEVLLTVTDPVSGLVDTHAIQIGIQRPPD